MNAVKLIFLVYFACFIEVVFSQELKEPALPSYQQILESQLKCDLKAFHKLPWLKERDSAHLATKVWTLVDQIELKEEDRKHLHDYGKTRSFTLSYRIYGVFRCGEPAVGFTGRQGKEVLFLPFLMQGWKHPGTFEIRGDQKTEKEESNNEEGRSVFDLTVSDYLGDEPPKFGREGFSCLVKLPDFIRSPKKAVDLNRLCQGEPKLKFTATEKEIQKVWTILKN